MSNGSTPNSNCVVDQAEPGSSGLVTHNTVLTPGPNLMIQPLGVSLTWPKFKAYSYSVSFITNKNVQGGWGYPHSRSRHKVRIKYKVCACVYVCECVCMCMHTHICASGKLLYTYCVSVRNKVEANVFPVCHHLAHGLL